MLCEQPLVLGEDVLAQGASLRGGEGEGEQGARSHAVVLGDLGELLEAGARGARADPELPVLQPTHALVVAPEALPQGASHEGAGIEVVATEDGPQVERGDAHASPLSAEELAVPVDHVARRIGGHVRHPLAQQERSEQVVGVEGQDERGPRGTEPVVPRGGEAALGLVQHLVAGALEPLEQGQGPGVGRAVVHDQQLVVGRRGALVAGEGVEGQVPVVVDRHDHADSGRLGAARAQQRARVLPRQAAGEVGLRLERAQQVAGVRVGHAPDPREGVLGVRAVEERGIEGLGIEPWPGETRDGCPHERLELLEALRQGVAAGNDASLAVTPPEFQQALVVRGPDRRAPAGVAQEHLGPDALHRRGDLPGEAIDEQEACVRQSLGPGVEGDGGARVLEAPGFRAASGDRLLEAGDGREEGRARDELAPRPAPVGVALGSLSGRGAEELPVQLHQARVLVVAARVVAIGGDQVAPQVHAQLADERADERGARAVHARDQQRGAHGVASSGGKSRTRSRSRWATRSRRAAARWGPSTRLRALAFRSLWAIACSTADGS